MILSHIGIPWNPVTYEFIAQPSTFHRYTDMSSGHKIPLSFHERTTGWLSSGFPGNLDHYNPQWLSRVIIRWLMSINKGNYQATSPSLIIRIPNNYELVDDSVGPCWLIVIGFSSLELIINRSIVEQRSERWGVDRASTKRHQCMYQCLWVCDILVLPVEYQTHIPLTSSWSK